MPSTVVLSDEIRFLPLIDYAEILEDKSGKLTIEDVASRGDFKPVVGKPSKKGGLDMGLTLSAFWLRVNWENQSKEEDWYLTHWGSLFRQSEVYLRPFGSQSEFVKFELQNRSRSAQYNLSLQNGEKYELYFRIQDRHTPLVIAPELVDAPSQLGRVMVDFPFFGFIAGGLLILAFYNFLYFIYLKDLGFLFVSAFILSFLMEMGNHSGLLYHYSFFRNNFHVMGSFFAFIAVASAIGLMYMWTDVPQNFPKLKPLFYLEFGVNIGLALASPFLPFTIAIAGAWGLFLLLLFFTYLFFFYKKGLRLPLSTVIAFAIFIVCTIPLLLRGVTLIDDIATIGDLSFFGLLIGLLFLSFTQTEQVNEKSKRAEIIVASSKAKDEFLTTMSHELRTPMNAVVSAGRLLQITSLSGEQKELVSRLGVSSQHMLSLINDILDLERVNSGSVLSLEEIPFRLGEVLNTLEKVLKEQAENKKVRLKLDNHFISLNKQLQGDPTRLKQVLLNLLANAIKFTEHGHVRLSITPTLVSQESVRLYFEISDTGIGIPKDRQKVMFQPFTQAESSTSRKYGGSGLGLAISYKLVNLMGGKLEVESTEGEGTRLFFTLDLPLKPEQKAKKEVSPKKISQLKLENFRVLLVDDDEMNRYFGQKLLKACGVKVAVAESGEDVLQKLQDTAIDLIFMDVSMPGMDGYETTEHIRNNAEFKNVPIIALTAHAVLGIKEKCLASGMDDFLTKPFELEALEVMIHKWLGAQKKQQSMSELS